MDFIINNFIWKDYNHLMSWKTITKLKQYVGLGMHIMQLNNVSHLGRLICSFPCNNIKLLPSSSPQQILLHAREGILQSYSGQWIYIGIYL